MSKEPVIKSTTNYKLFKVVRGNRPVSKRHLNNLIRSIEENNMLAENPIMVNEDMKVLDGQHRLQAAEELGLPIYYVVVPTGGLREIQMLNTNVRRWTTIDFLNSFIERGYADYKELKDFSEIYNVSVPIAMSLLSGGFGVYGTKSKLTESFREGQFKITSRNEAVEFMHRLSDIAPFTVDNSFTDREFLRALERVYKNVSHEELMEVMKRANPKIGRHGNTRGYVREFEDVLSWRKKSVKRIE